MMSIPSSQQVTLLRYIGKNECVVNNEDGKVFLLKVGAEIEANLLPS